VVVPIEVPFTIMEAFESGTPLSSVTLPVIFLLCANKCITINSMHMENNTILLMWYIY
jgi:hypothetical protein